MIGGEPIERGIVSGAVMGDKTGNVTPRCIQDETVHVEFASALLYQDINEDFPRLDSLIDHRSSIMQKQSAKPTFHANQPDFPSRLQIERLRQELAHAQKKNQEYEDLSTCSVLMDKCVRFIVF